MVEIMIIIIYILIDEHESKLSTRHGSDFSNSCFDFNEDEEAQVLILDEDRITYIDQDKYFEGKS